MYNISKGRLHLLLKKHKSRVTTALLVCPDPGKEGLVGDGALYIGFNNGYVCVWNARYENDTREKLHFFCVQKHATFFRRKSCHSSSICLVRSLSLLTTLLLYFSSACI